MTTADAITAIRTATRYDIASPGSPSPVTDAQVTVWLDQTLKRFRRTLNSVVPALYKTVDVTQVVAAPNQTINKPADFERLIRIEKLSGTTWATIEPSSETDQGYDRSLGFEELGNSYLIWPLASAPGSYRIVYAKTITSGYTTLEVPEGLEDYVIEMVSSRVKVRLNPAEASLHVGIANQILGEQMPHLKRRYGTFNRSGFRMSARSGGYFVP